MGALDGVRVLDLTRLLPGPFASLVLADLGATVDKVEDTEQGDYLRHLPPTIAGSNAAFGMLNRGKRSIVLNLKDARGREVFEAMLPRYDVLFEQFRPGVMARLGFAPEELRRRFPKLVVCSLTGYGQTGPLAKAPGHDLNYIARSGILGHQGKQGEAPNVPGFQTADISGGMWCVIGILAALMERQRTGEGAWLDIAMSEGTLPFNLIGLAASMAGAPPGRGDDQLTGGIAPYGIYRGKDGRFITFAALEPKFWMKFAALHGLEPSMSDLVPGEHQAALRARLDAVFATKDAADWASFGVTNDVPIEVVTEPHELANDEHLAARGVLFHREEAGQRVPQLRTPVSGEHVRAARLAPAQGADTRTILSEAGLSDAAIEALLSAGIAR